MSYNKIKDFGFVLFCFLILNLTYHKIGPIKVTELILLILLPIVFLKRTSKYLFYFIIIYIFFVLKTFSQNLFGTLEYFRPYNEIGLLSKPYLITISRFIEVLTCIVFANCVYQYLKNMNGERKKKILIAIIKIHFYFSIIFGFIFLLAYLDIIRNEALIVTYDQPWDVNDNTLRLRGFFIEGGPFGLMLSMIFNLTYYFKPKHLIRIRIVLFITIVFFAQSKSGLLCVIFWFMFMNWNTLKRKLQSVSYLFFIPLLLSFLFIFSLVGERYISKMMNLENEIAMRPDDGMLLTGRTSAFYISKNMIVDKPILGVGLGNYIYNRNKEIYRGFVPEFPEEYVLPRIGLGGLFTLLVENGILGLILFSLLVYSIYKKFKYSRNRNLIILFVVVFLLGVEMTFAYPYFLLGLILSENIAYKL